MFTCPYSEYDNTQLHRQQETTQQEPQDLTENKQIIFLLLIMLIRVQFKDLCGVLKPYIMYLNNYFKYTVNLCQPNAWRNYFQGRPANSTGATESDSTQTNNIFIINK